MAEQHKISIRFYNHRQVRAVWDDENNKWWFSAVDIVRAINDEPDYVRAGNYWRWLKRKLAADGIQLVSVTHDFKFEAPDGKKRAADALDSQCVEIVAKHYLNNADRPHRCPLTLPHRTLKTYIEINSIKAEKKPIDYGIVYLVTNPVMPGLDKIGMTAQEDIVKQLRELYTTSVLMPFVCEFACQVKKTDCAKIENGLHTAFAPQRINASREFFRIQVDQAKAILELFHHVDETEDIANEIENDLTDDDRDAIIKQKSHSSALKFMKMDFKVSDVLYWKDEPSIMVTIHSDRRLRYNGKEMAISAVSRELKESKWYVAPSLHWLFKDRLLNEIYDETYPIEEGYFYSKESTY